jgi:hypothetical protein
MSVIFHKKVDGSDLPAGCVAEIHLVCIEITNVEECVSQLIELISSTSWIQQLEPIGQATFKVRAQRTIVKLLKIFNGSDGAITSEIGEYSISINAGQSLGDQFGHKVFPIAELWKEKVIGNPGFDFHTESNHKRISFGEAKYQKNSNPYTKSANQILSFIKDGKDQGDTSDLKSLSASNEAINKLLALDRGFCVAFSLYSTDYETILVNALKSDPIKEISKQCGELYVIGVRHASS